ncbi:Protein Y46E12BL.2, partial [Aphelenchoides avenae]
MGVRHAALKCIYRVLKRKPSCKTLSSKKNIQLIHDLRRLQPEPSETAVWLEAMIEAHVCLAEKPAEADDSAGAALITETVEICVKLFNGGSKRL